MKAGKKTKLWNATRAKLKQQFFKNQITRCEICNSDFGLSFAHRLKRRYITTQEELETVALLCIPCHETVERSANMTELIDQIIEARH